MFNLIDKLLYRSKLKTARTLFSHVSAAQSDGHFGSDSDMLTAIGWMNMKFGSGSRGLWRMNCNNFGDSLTFHLVPQSVQ